MSFREYLAQQQQLIDQERGHVRLVSEDDDDAVDARRPS